jgi:hypothetical protein
MRFAVVRNGKVENVVEWDGNLDTWQPPEGCSTVLAEDKGSPGDLFDGSEFTTPEPAPREKTETELLCEDLAALRAEVETLKAARGAR